MSQRPRREAKRRVGDNATNRPCFWLSRSNGSSAEKVDSSSHFPVPREASAKEATSPTPPRDHFANASDKARTLVEAPLYPVPGLLEHVCAHEFPTGSPKTLVTVGTRADVFQDSWNRPAPLSPDDWEEPARPLAK
ncbi:hypothetical protein EIP91_003609 [Steccherinum ochraceum]|uniref:Uncharacterized protein n=1 Tax=Steccherinum ochraceum TaxID=92696 RepID=A0A4V2MW64_9APHY|nr:hypothetical protein EIP91_003609 [Steccherinum ochraceum]